MESPTRTFRLGDSHIALRATASETCVLGVVRCLVAGETIPPAHELRPLGARSRWVDRQRTEPSLDLMPESGEEPGDVR